MTVLDGIALIVMAFILAPPYPLLVHPIWAGIFLLAGVSIALVGLFGLTHRQRAWIAGLFSFPVLARVLFLLITGIRTHNDAYLMLGMLWGAFGTHVVVRLAFWPIMDQALPGVGLEEGEIEV